MSQKFLLSPRQDTVCISLYDTLTSDDIRLDYEMGLNMNVPVYLLVDASMLTSNISFEVIQKLATSSLTHKNIAHIAVYAKTTQAQFLAVLSMHYDSDPDRMSVHRSYAEAMAFLNDCADGLVLNPLDRIAV